MAIERILGTDTGKAAFEKSDRNFNSLDANKQENILGAVTSGQSILSFCDSQTKGGSFFIYVDATDNPCAEWGTGFLMQTNDGHANKAVLVITQSNKVYTNKQINSIWSGWKKIVTDKQPEWINATLQNGWLNYGGSAFNAEYMKDEFGYVHLRGLIKNGISGAVALILPLGYRPSKVTTFPLITDAFLTSGGRAELVENGIVYISGTNGWVSLDNIYFLGEV